MKSSNSVVRNDGAKRRAIDIGARARREGHPNGPCAARAHSCFAPTCSARNLTVSKYWRDTDA
eukprot:1294475-Pyramimonas_sp.AAC.1